MLLTNSVSGWRNVQLLLKATKATQEATVKRALRALANSDEALCREVHVAWGEAAHTLRRKMKGKEQRMKEVMKTLAYGDANLQAEVLLLWKGIAADERNARLLREALEKNEEMTEKMKRQKLAAVEKCFANEGRALMATFHRAWKAEIQAKHLAAKLKDRSMHATLKRILSSDEALRNECFTAWKEDWAEWRKEKDLAAAEERKKNVEEARQRALAFFQQQP